MFSEIKNRIAKTNEQRIKMYLLLYNIMKSEAIPVETRSTVAASMLEMLKSSMIPEDKDIIELMNDGIDNVCGYVQKQYGIPDYRSALEKIVENTSEKINRISEGEAILKSFNLNNINLN